MNPEVEQLKRDVQELKTKLELALGTLKELNRTKIDYEMPYEIRDNIIGAVIQQTGYIGGESTPSYLVIRFNGKTWNVMMNANVLSGAGAPTFSAPKGTLYLNTTGSSTTTRAYINTDASTTWTSITTAA